MVGGGFILDTSDKIITEYSKILIKGSDYSELKYFWRNRESIQ